MNMKKIMAGVVASAVAASVLAVSASAEWTAALTFQTTTYMYRDTFAQSHLYVWDDDIGEPVDIDGASYSDAEITGDGTYVVELNGVEDAGWNMLKLDTSINYDEYPDVVLTITKVELNGEEVDFDAEAAAMNIEQNAKSNSYSDYEYSISNAVRAQLINTYDKLAAIPNETYTSVKVTFEITGLGGEGGNVEDTDDGDDTDTASDAAGTGDTSAATADKGNADTGVEGVAAVAGVAIIAAGAIIVAKKRK